MDDPWSNAWSDPPPTKKTTSTSVPLESSWTTSIPIEETESDVGSGWGTEAAAWTSPARPIWDRPQTKQTEVGAEAWLPTPSFTVSETNVTTHHVDPHNADFGDRLDAVSEVRPSNLDDDEENEDEDEDEDEDEVFHDAPTKTVTPVQTTPPTPVITSPPPPEIKEEDTFDDTDGFGTFETGNNTPSYHIERSDSSGDAWSSIRTPEPENLSGDAWQSVWTPEKADEGDATPQDPPKPKDEWEVAKEQKLRRDRAAPPEVVAAILQDCKLLSATLWPQQPGSEQDVKPLTGLTEDNIINALVPTTLSTRPMSFSTSQLAKASVNEIKLTKNLAMVRASPLSQMASAKGFSDWEISVKNKVEVIQDDIPTGWRIVEQTPAPATPLAEKKASGVWSLWGRRTNTATPPVSVVPKVVPKEVPSNSKPASPVVTDPAPTTPVAEQQPTPFQPQSTHTRGVSVSSIRSVSQAPSRPTTPAAVLAQAPTSIAPERPSLDATSSNASGAPSAMSRFLSRFSRSRGSISSRSASRDSIPLSSDDLEFLSDLVPSASGGQVDDDPFGLTEMLSKPVEDKLPPLLAPPPLPPPPRAPPPLTGPQSSLPASPSQGFSPSSLFDDFDFAPAPIPGPPKRQPSLPVPLSPAFSSKPPTPSPLSTTLTGGSHKARASESMAGKFHLREFSAPSSSSSPRAETFSAFGKLPLPPSVKATGSRIIPPPPPPILSKPSALAASQNAVNLDDDDEFGDFDSVSPVVPSQNVLSFDIGFSPPKKLSYPEPPSAFGNTSFGDFGEFVESDLPPQPVSPPPLPPQKPPVQQQQPMLKPILTADHQVHQMSELLTKAASHHGQWPAPRSPLPTLLPPPPGSSNMFPKRQQQTANLLDGLDMLSSSPPQQTGRDLFLLPPPKPADSSLFKLPPPPASSPPPPTSNGLSLFNQNFNTTPISPSTSPPPFLGRQPVFIQNFSPPSSLSPTSPPPSFSGNPSGPSLFSRNFSPTPPAITSTSSSPPPLIGKPPGSLFNQAFTPTASASSRPTPASTITPKGGLSAQDLSFFEGL